MGIRFLSVGVGDFCPFQMLLGRTCYSVINIPPELREINSPSEHVAMASAAQHGTSKLRLAAPEWLRMLHCSSSPPFCSEASSFIRMSNFCLFALYINHHFYKQHRRMFSLPFAPGRKGQAKMKFLAERQTKNQTINILFLLTSLHITSTIYFLLTNGHYWSVSFPIDF